MSTARRRTGSILDTVFVLFLVAALGLGTTIVAVQTIGLASTDPRVVEWPDAMLNTPAVLCAAVAGIAAFLRTYLGDESKDGETA
ncbi:hypothetical protein WIS52_19325 [Pseudonocardia nematodicida]|uniref:Holin n=1 Tax=Pseudonocardia nematodicida TaxID=1206997 RepID=A0ABV1KDT6_9PSEU